MRPIGRALMEILGVVAAGFLGFFVVLAYMAGRVVWFTCGRRREWPVRDTDS